MTGDILTDKIGAYLLDPDGKYILDDGGSLGCAGNLHTGARPPLCKEINTCLAFCNDAIAGMQRSPDCECPCSQNRDFPPTHSIRVSIGVKTGVKISSVTPGDGTFYELVGPSSISVTGVYGCVAVNEAYTVNHYDTDGVTLLDSQSNHIVGSLGVNPGVCGETDRPDPKRVYVIANARIDAGFAGLDRSIAGTTDPGLEAIIVGNEDRCNGGSGDIAAGSSPFASGGGSYSVDPACEDCDGEPLQTSGSPATVCAFEYDVFSSIADGPGGSSRSHSYVLLGGGSWSGVDEYGNAATITPIDADPNNVDFECCPTVDPDGCDCDAFGCPGCWLLTITDSNGDTWHYFSYGSCPGQSGWEAVDMGAPGISGGFVEGCPPPP